MTWSRILLLLLVALALVCSPSSGQLLGYDSSDALSDLGVGNLEVLFNNNLAQCPTEGSLSMPDLACALGPQHIYSTESGQLYIDPMDNKRNLVLSIGIDCADSGKLILFDGARCQGNIIGNETHMCYVQDENNSNLYTCCGNGCIAQLLRPK